MGVEKRSKAATTTATEEECAENRYLINAIKEFQRKHKIVQKDIGKRLGHGQSWFSKYLTKLTSVKAGMPVADLLTIAEACKICKAMGSSLGEVLYEYEHKIAQKIPDYAETKKEEYFGDTNDRNIPVYEKNIPTYDNIPGKPSLMDLPMRFPTNANLTSDIHDPVFQSWTGIYHCYFYSTLSTEDRCFRGILNIPEESQNGLCNVSFRFTYDEKRKRSKEYYGYLVLSKNPSGPCGAYCTLFNHDDLGEITYLVMTNSGLRTKRVCCALALVTTISGGKNTNHPCVERMIISREELEGERFELAKAHLLLNDKYIRMTEDDFIKMLKCKNIPNSFRMRFQDAEHPFENYYIAEYVQKIAIIPESWVKSLPGYTERQKQEIIDQMRLYSVAPRINKINQKAAENDIHEMFQKEYDNWFLYKPEDDTSEEVEDPIEECTLSDCVGGSM